MTPDTAAATRIIADVTRDQPRGLYLLAVHASLPAAVDATLLHHLRDNFLLDGPPADRLPVTPGSEAHLARLLLSPLFSQVDSDLYEMVPAVRAVLLDALSRLHGGQRLAEVAALLERYTVQASPWVDRPELQWAQRVSARVVSDPAAVDEWLAQAGTSESSGLDDRWFAAMRARIDRDRDLAAAAIRARDSPLSDTVARGVARSTGSVQREDGSVEPPAFRVLTGGLYLTVSPVTDRPRIVLPVSYRSVDGLTLSVLSEGSVAAILAVDSAIDPGESDEALVLGAPPLPADTLFVVSAQAQWLWAERVRVNTIDQQTFVVTTDEAINAMHPVGWSVAVDEAGRLVGMIVSDRIGRNGRLVCTAVNVDRIVDWLATETDPDTVAHAVRAPRDGALCLRLGEAALRLGRLRQADEFAALALNVLDDSPESQARVLLLNARVAKQAGGDHSSMVNEAHLLLDQLPADSEAARALAREIVALVGGGGGAPEWLPSRLTVLIGQFDAGGRRNRSMTAADVVAAMPAELTAGQIAGLQASPSPGARLLAAARLQMVPDPAELWWLAAHVHPDTENPDVGYQAASALRAAAEQLPSEHFGDLEVALQEARRALAHHRPSTRATIVDEASDILARRRARAASSADLGWEDFNGLPELAARYAAVRRIGISLSGREVIVARERATGTLVVIRLGQRSDESMNPAVAEAIGGYPNRYVTGPVEWGRDGDTEFEIHDYVAGGSLAELRQRRRPAWPVEEVEPVLIGLLEAVTYLHTRRVIHRNLSPTSVLVRSEAPLELVLTSLDHAVTFGDPRVPTARLRPAYTAPEMTTGTASPAVDWWSVGIVLFDLLTGRNPFQRSDRAWRDSDEIVRYLAVHDIDLTPVSNPRWALLLRGLLTREPSSRWGTTEIRRWLIGESPDTGRPPSA